MAKGTQSKRTKAKKIKRVLTGMRPTGPLHIGHLLGALGTWLEYQKKYECYFLIADYQILSDHLDDVRKGKIPGNVRDMLLDWLAVGLNPQKSYFVLQSQVPQLSELTMYFSFLVTVARLRRNPTLKNEARNIGIDSDKDQIALGFLGYPVSQAADILLFKGEYVPVGEDQMPHLEQTREIARKFNHYFKKIFPEPKAILSNYPRILGLDGRKMSKSLNNAILLKDSPEIIRKKIKRAMTDSGREIKYDPKKKPMISNLIKIYAGFSGKDIRSIENRFKGKGYEYFKKDLANLAVEKLKPIQEKRRAFAENPDYLRKVLIEGTERARKIGEETMKEVREAVFGYRKLFRK